jgi:hypothetical protein
VAAKAIAQRRRRRSRKGDEAQKKRFKVGQAARLTYLESCGAAGAAPM